MPPWSHKQLKVAQAIEHDWQPKGSARGFTKSFASQVIEEGEIGKKRKKAAEQRLGRGAKPAMKG